MLVLTNKRQVLRVLTNKRRVLRVLTNERRVLPVDPLALDAEAEQVADVLLALGLLGQLLALALLPSLLKLTNERGVLRVLINEKRVIKVMTKNTE